MDTDRSIEIVQSLADGVDPYSGERFPSSSPYHQADTLHTLTNGMTDGYAVRMESSLGMNVASERTAWEYAVCSGQINDDDDPLETDPGGYACVCTNNLTPLNLKVQPTDLPGKVRLSATTGGQRIRLWENADRTGEVVLPKEWNSVTNVPSALYVEGVTNSAAACDVTLALTYDENPPNQNNTLFKCEDKVRLTILSVDLTAYRPTTELPAYGNPFQRHEVPDDLEESPKAGIRVNGDTESSANENDLIEVQLDVAPFPVPSGLTCVLKRNNSNIKVWDSRDMSGSCLLDATSGNHHQQFAHVGLG